MNMKKTIFFALAGVMSLGLAACSGENVKTTSGDSIPPASSQTASGSQNKERPESVTIISLNASKEETELEVPYDPQRIAILDMASLDILDALGVAGGRVVGSADTSLDYLQSYVTDENVANLGTIKTADLEAVMAAQPDVIFIGGRLAKSYDALSEIAPVVYLATDSELGVVERVVGTADTSLEYLQNYINDDISSLGTIKEADLEAVMACEPDVIFIGGRLASSYDALSEIAPVVYLATDTELGVVESVRRNAMTIASMFGLEDKVDELMAGFNSRIAALAEFSAGKTAIIGLVTSGSFNVLGNDGRCSMIGREIGFENIGAAADIDTSTHGNEASFEFIVEKDPDYIFVMDRDAAIGTDGAQLAQEIMENELVMGTDAYKNGHLVYLAHPAVWYTAEGGITALDLMLKDLESSLLG